MNAYHFIRLFFISLFLLIPATASAVLQSGGDPFHESDRSPITRQLQSDASTLNGGYQHTVDLTVPPSRAIPFELKLQYDSNNTDQMSPFGYGWSINIPYIERIPRNGSDELYSENFFASTLDGELSATSSTEYGARVENGAFRKYERVGDHWVVTDKEGTTWTFGDATTAQIVDSASSTKIYRWYLEEIRDLDDNYIEYTYLKDDGYVYPSKITYTGHGSTDGIYAIEFDREARSDAVTSYRSGFEVTSDQRIEEIRIEVQDVWRKKYNLGYTAGDNGVRSLLATITEHGQSEDSVTDSMPTTTLTYTDTSNESWTTDSGYSIPIYFTNPNGDNEGVIVLDVNGDALADIVRAQEGSTDKVYINDGDGTGWTDTAGYTIPVDFITSGGNDRGVRFADVDADGFIDIIHGYDDGTNYRDVYINDGDGTGWTLDASYNMPVVFINNTTDEGVRVMDVDGDGLPDIVQSADNGTSVKKVFTNDGDGTGWTEDTNYAIPVHFANNGDQGVRFSDVNGDGLIDIVQSYDDGTSNKHVWINDGDGTGWTEDTGYTIPVYFFQNSSQGVRFFDVNRDGLPDLVQSYHDGSNHQHVWLNDGDGTGWSEDTGYSIPEYYFNNTDQGVRNFDINGDGLSDFIRSVNAGGGSSAVQTVRISNDERPDKLKRVVLPQGGQIDIAYKGSAETTDSGGGQSNPELPFNQHVVDTVERDDNFGNTGVTTYHYGAGSYYYNDEYDRRFAGFGSSTVTNSYGHVEVSYQHQGNDSQTSIGENSDDFAKIGKTFRVETYDASDNLYQKTITKWVNRDLGDERDFVYAEDELVMTYDGDADHKDSAVERSYDSYGNVYIETQYGEVSGSDNGTFTDTGSDKRTIEYAYAKDATDYVVSLPKTITTKNNGGTRVAETKIYYDTLAHGSVDEGNPTKEERWVTGSTYVDVERTFDTYGNVTQEKDERNNATDFDYERFNLYVATTTDAEGLVTERTYDYSSGLVLDLTDPNGRVFSTEYDMFDRPDAEKIPDHLGNPNNQVIKTTWSYLDSSGAFRVTKTDSLSNATSSFARIYYDGFGREIQRRLEAEPTSQYFVTNTLYDAEGNVGTTSLPYQQYGNSYSAITTDSDLLIVNTYDPLGRIAKTTDGAGTISRTYDQWEEVVNDREGNNKDFQYDAFGNLIEVDEHVGASVYDTKYEYDALDNLTKLTDENGNVRNFTYDGLSRLTNNQDLHDPSDGTFGSTTNQYDNASNLTQTANPNNHVVTHTYDNNNRVLTEDFQGAAGTEIEYGYDACPEGAGRLCAATTTDVTTTFAYDALGNVVSEVRTIDGSTYTTGFTFDRQGNLTSITYPDSSVVKYHHNAAGQLEAISRDGVSLIDDIDYNAVGAVTFRRNGAGTETVYTYDDADLYRLTNITTIPSDMIVLGATAESREKLQDTLSDTAIDELIKSKTPKERAALKASEYRNIGKLDRTTKGKYELEVLNINQVEDGVEVFVRAWDKNGKQLGFGEDGSVDIERFRIFNPPILVQDDNGEITRTFERPNFENTTEENPLPVMEEYTVNYRVDPEAALLEVLEQTLEVKKQKFDETKIKKGKVGNTTSTFYTSDGTGSDLDGAISKASGGNSWNTVHDASTGDSECVTGTHIKDCSYGYTAGVGYKWTTWMIRGVSIFDTSAIPSSNTIDSATLSYYSLGNNADDNDGQDYISVVQVQAGNLKEVVPKNRTLA